MLAVVSIGSGLTQIQHKWLSLVLNWEIKAVMGQEGTDIKLKRLRHLRHGSMGNQIGSCPSYDRCKEAQDAWFEDKGVFDYICYGSDDMDSGYGAYTDLLFQQMEWILNKYVYHCRSKCNHGRKQRVEYDK